MEKMQKWKKMSEEQGEDSNKLIVNSTTVVNYGLKNKKE